MSKMKFGLVVSLVMVAQYSLIGTIVQTNEDCESCEECESALDMALLPLYSQLDTFWSQLEAVKALARTPCEKASEWQLVFKGMAGTGFGIYDMWTTTSWDENTMGVSGSWRDESLHEAWKSGELNVTRVKLSVRDFEGRRADLIFNGTGTDIHNWFTQERLISSPWEDVKSTTPNYFSTDGFAANGRRFYMSKSHYACTYDRGWLVVKESLVGGDCDWEKNSTEYPSFPLILYSRSTIAARWRVMFYTGDVTVGRADFLTIHVDTE